MNRRIFQRIACTGLAAALGVLPMRARASSAPPHEARPSDDDDAAADPPPPEVEAPADEGTPTEGGAEDGADPPAAEAEAATPEPLPPTDRQRAASAFREGTKDYELGQYEQAIERFQKAWELAPEPQLLYNLGQAHWKWFDVDPDIDHLRKARTFFQNYDKRMRLRDDYSSSEVEGYIRALTAQIDAEEAKAAERARPVIVDPSLEQRDAAERRRLERERKLRVTKGLNVSGVTLIVLGSATLAMALGGLIARQANRVILDNSTGGEPGTTNLASASEDAKRRRGYVVGGQVAFSGFILAGVLLPVGITLRVIGGVREKRTIGGDIEREKPVSMGAGSSLLTIRF